MMNERIKELAKQAFNQIAQESNVPAEKFTDSLDKDVREQVDQMFGELIVRECIAQARSEEDRFYGIGESDLALTMEHFQEVLKQHFGVEE